MSKLASYKRISLKAHKKGAFPPCLSTKAVVMFERVCRDGMRLDMSTLREAHLRAFATETAGELDVLGLNGDTEEALVDDSMIT